MIVAKTGQHVLYELNDPAELAKAQAQSDRFRKNSDWLQVHVAEVYAKHRGKCICVAGQELFTADTADEAINRAKQAHPDDDGFLLRYIPLVKMERIYAH